MSAAQPVAATLPAEALGREARAAAHDHSAVKLWLRLLACSTQIEHVIRTRLRERFATTLPRFDTLAQLERHPQGLRMSELSRDLMVTGGNVTGLVESLIGEGLVQRAVDAADRRSVRVRLTPRGRRQFLVMAAEHERWLIELLADFDGEARSALYEGLGRLRAQLHHVQHQRAHAQPHRSHASRNPSRNRSRNTRR